MGFTIDVQVPHTMNYSTITDLADPLIFPLSAIAGSQLDGFV